MPGSRTTEQLRRRIDSGQLADKVDFPDPAAAPLGTDSEAGGDAPQAQMSPSLPAEVVRKSTTHWTSGPIIYISILMSMIAAALALLWQLQ